MALVSASPTRAQRPLVFVAAFALAASVLLPASPAVAVDGIIQGVVTTSLGGGVLPGVQVILSSDDGFNVDQVASTTTDVDGEYSFSNLAYTGYKVEFRGGGLTPPHANQFHDGTYGTSFAVTFPVTDSTPVVKNVELEPGSTINGTVSGEFGPPANGVVSLGHHINGLYTGFFTFASVAPNGTWQAINLPAGEFSLRYTDLLPSATNYRTHYHDQILLSSLEEFFTVPVGAVVAVNARMTQAGPIPVERLAGADRYATAIAVSQTFDSFNGAADSYVYVASGTNYPDALSAAPAAAKREAPLLLTPPSTLPADVEAEIERLDPERIVVAGGAGAVSNSVFRKLQDLVDNPANVTRIGGADRYATSRLLVEDAFDNALNAFVATGRNFPDALAAGAAAARLFGPVILIDGTAGSVNAATETLIDDLGVETLYVAGGTGVVSPGAAADLATVPGVTEVIRLGGADRYATSLAINDEVFDTAFDAYLATGEGFADALAGAALAGSRFAPLYTVQRTCIPGGVLSHFRAIEVDELYLLGGTGVLTSSVARLTRC